MEERKERDDTAARLGCRSQTVNRKILSATASLEWEPILPTGAQLAPPIPNFE